MIAQMNKTLPALAAAALLVAGTTAPSYANGNRAYGRAPTAAYCRDYAAQASRADTDDALMLILPLTAIGAGAGALVGVAASGIAVGTGAAVGAAGGAGLGLVGTSAQAHGSYREAYRACLRGEE